jgi:hypothetical protein
VSTVLVAADWLAGEPALLLQATRGSGSLKFSTSWTRIPRGRRARCAPWHLRSASSSGPQHTRCTVRTTSTLRLHMQEKEQYQLCTYDNRGVGFSDVPGGRHAAAHGAQSSPCSSHQATTRCAAHQPAPSPAACHDNVGFAPLRRSFQRCAARPRSSPAPTGLLAAMQEPRSRKHALMTTLISTRTAAQLPRAIQRTDCRWRTSDMAQDSLAVLDQV